MLRVTIELIPGGIENHPRREVIGVAEIWNDGTGSPTTGHYGSRFFKRGTKQVYREAKVTNFPRLRKNAWYLLAQILKAGGFL